MPDATLLEIAEDCIGVVGLVGEKLLHAGPQLPVDRDVIHGKLAVVPKPGFDHARAATVSSRTRAHVRLHPQNDPDITSSVRFLVIRVEQWNKVRGYWAFALFQSGTESSCSALKTIDLFNIHPICSTVPA
jgi:hypothetical protein